MTYLNFSPTNIQATLNNLYEIGWDEENFKDFDGYFDSNQARESAAMTFKAALENDDEDLFQEVDQFIINVIDEDPEEIKVVNHENLLETAVKLKAWKIAEFLINDERYFSLEGRQTSDYKIILEKLIKNGAPKELIELESEQMSEIVNR